MPVIDSKTPPTDAKIRTVYIICHTHTDIGYTDYQDTLFRRQDAIMESAVDLCEATADAPDGAQFRWTAEISSLTEDFLNRAPATLVDRFRALEQAGRISVMGLPWHWTSLVTPAVAVRELEAVARLRHDHQITVRSAVQCDVNGLAGFWVDLLAASGISRLAMFANPHRGLVDDGLPRAFNWVGPGGGRLLTWQGWHYSIGGNLLRLGSEANDLVAPRLEARLAPLEQRARAGDYPYDFTLVTVTNYANADNNWPQHGLSEAVAEWNASGREPRLEIVTVDQFLDVLERQSHTLPDERGDWADPWVDGVASTARETSLSRAAERLLPTLETLAATGESSLTPAALRDLTRSMALYDEHTWGAYSSVSLPEIPFTQSQLVDKRRFAHRSFWVAHEHLAGVARTQAGAVSEGPVECDPVLGRRTAPDLDASEQSYLVVNTTGRSRRIVWPLTTDRGSERPHHVLHSLLSNHHYPGMGLSESATIKFGAIGGNEPGTGHIDVTLPPFGRAIVKPVPDTPAGQLGEQSISNPFYDLRVDPQTGAIASLLDKADGIRIEAAADGATGALFAGFLETLPESRNAIFTSDFVTYKGMTWHDPVFDRTLPADVSVETARMSWSGPEITCRLHFSPGVDAIVTYRLPNHAKCVEVDIVQSMTRADTDIRALYWQIAAGEGTKCTWRFDQGGRMLAPEESVSSSCSSWVATHDAVTMTASDQPLALAVVPLDTPLVMPGSMRPIGSFGEPRTEVETLYFWAYNNHWDTNFAAYEVGALPARFRLTTGSSLSDEQVQDFAEGQAVAPVIVRVPEAEPRSLAPLVEIRASQGDPEALAMNLRVIGDGRIVVSTRNRADKPFQGAVRLPDRSIARAALSSPLGEEHAPLTLSRDGVPCSLAAGATAWWTLTLAG
jgi:alpha-mannosidase